MEVAIFAIATFFNLAILKYKFEKGKHTDLLLDVIAIVALSVMFGGTMGGMIIAMIASFIFSLYLLISPPKFKLL